MDAMSAEQLRAFWDKLVEARNYKLEHRARHGIEASEYRYELKIEIKMLDEVIAELRKILNPDRVPLNEHETISLMGEGLLPVQVAKFGLFLAMAMENRKDRLAKENLNSGDSCRRNQFYIDLENEQHVIRWVDRELDMVFRQAQ